MTLFIVCTFHGGPVAVFSDMPDAHAYVMKQPGKYNSFEVEELELDVRVHRKARRSTRVRGAHAGVIDV